MAMAFDALRKLTEAGTPVEKFSDEQRAVLSSLTEHEIEVLTAVQARLDAAGGGEVEGQDNNFRSL